MTCAPSGGCFLPETFSWRIDTLDSHQSAKTSGVEAMSNQDPQSFEEARRRRSAEILKGALADEEFMRATREGVEASLRGEQGVPVRQVQEEARRRREGR